VYPAPGSDAPPTQVALPFCVQLGPRVHYEIRSPSQFARSIKGANCATDCPHEVRADKTCPSCSMRLDVTIESADGETPRLRTALTTKGVLLQALLTRDPDLPTYFAPTGDQGSDAVDKDKSYHDVPSNEPNKCYTKSSAGGVG